jgi:peptidoglycan lytic transglycosylase A
MLSRDECRAVLADDWDLGSLQRAAEQSLEYYRRVPEDRELALLDHKVTVRQLRSVVESLVGQPLRPGDATFLCDRFRLARVTLTRPLLVTGYYEPELDARRRRSERFRYPLYGVPEDLVEVDLGAFCAACSGRRALGRVSGRTLVPYYTRAEIDAGAIDGRAAVIAWLDDPVEAFFLHVQGSALLRFDDGVHVHVSFAASNGRPYTSIGRLLVEAGKVRPEDVSLATLKDYLRAHRDEGQVLEQRNERYVFFRTVPVGPIGSLDVPLTAGRSIAADARFYPPGALALLKTRGGQNGRDISRLTLVQDAGAAIQGDDRLDVFWGSGDTAAAIAGAMRAHGDIYFLLPPSAPDKS